MADILILNALNKRLRTQIGPKLNRATQRLNAVSRHPGVRQSHLASGMCRDRFEHSRYERHVRPEREAKTMIDITYDPEADAVYIKMGRADIDRTEEAGPFIYDVDS